MIQQQYGIMICLSLGTAKRQPQAQVCRQLLRAVSSRHAHFLLIHHHHHRRRPILANSYRFILTSFLSQNYYCFSSNKIVHSIYRYLNIIFIFGLSICMFFTLTFFDNDNLLITTEIIVRIYTLVLCRCSLSCPFL